MCVCVFFYIIKAPSRWIQSFIAKTQQVKYVDRNALSMFKALDKGCN